MRGGCTIIKGCIEVVPFSTADGIKSICIACDDKYYTYEPINKTCLCKVGFSAGDYCSDITGCISTYKVNGSVTCIFCDSKKNFRLDIITRHCVCIDGFSIINAVCTDICGDGIVHKAACDDGNVENGDGCSSSCEV